MQKEKKKSFWQKFYPMHCIEMQNKILNTKFYSKPIKKLKLNIVIRLYFNQ